MTLSCSGNNGCSGRPALSLGSAAVIRQDADRAHVRVPGLVWRSLLSYACCVCSCERLCRLLGTRAPQISVSRVWCRLFERIGLTLALQSHYRRRQHAKISEYGGCRQAIAAFLQQRGINICALKKPPAWLSLRVLDRVPTLIISCAVRQPMQLVGAFDNEQHQLRSPRQLRLARRTRRCTSYLLMCHRPARVAYGATWGSSAMPR